jgi:hypothetical protein
MVSFSAAMDSIRLLGFRSCRMNFPPESPQSARARPPRSFLISDFQRPPAFQLCQNAPFFSATSFSPASGPATDSFLTKGQAFKS